MPTDQAVWGIEIGQCALKALRLRYNPETEKVDALAFDYIEHPKILSQPDADPEALVREALQTFLSRNTVKGDRICIGVPGQSGLARFIKLPPVEQSRIPEIVKYEARQQIPFALEDVVWDFQTIGKTEETEGFALETEIGLFAMKRDLIARFLNPYQEAGVEVDVVQMRPLADYNFVSFDRLLGEPAAAAERAESGEELEQSPQAGEAAGFVVLLDIGADNSDLVITDGTRIWQRNLPLGGNHFTRALTKELKLTFAKAEHLKRNATKAQDPRAIFQAMRPVFNDFVSEIQRSIGYFASVHRQSKIARILGLGNAFKLPGLTKFLGQNLHYEVEKLEGFSRLEGAAVLSAPVFQENLLSFAAAYGLALQGLEVAPIRTNLLPPEIAQARMIRRKKPWALTAAAILLVGFTSLFTGNWMQLRAVAEQRYKPAETEAAAAKDVQKKGDDAFNAAVAAWNGVRSNGETLTSNVEGRLNWLEILAAINKALPQNPAGIDPKTQLTSVKQVQIQSITAQWYPDLKVWANGHNMTVEGWPKITAHGLDKANPPSGEGWGFVLMGHHFNKDGYIYTPAAVFDPPNGLQSAAFRQIGLSHAILTTNVTDTNWVPGAVPSGPRRSPATSGGGASSNARAGGGMGMGAGGANVPMNAGSGAGSAGAGRGGGMGVQDSGEALNSGGEAGAEQGEGAFGQGRMTITTTGQVAINSVPRTDFRIEFVWQPKKKPDRKPLAELDAEMAKYPKTKVSEAEAKAAEAAALTAPPVTAPNQGTGPNGSTTNPTEVTPPATSAPAAPGSTPQANPGTAPGTAAPPGAATPSGTAPGPAPLAPPGQAPAAPSTPAGTGATPQGPAAANPTAPAASSPTPAATAPAATPNR